MASNQSRVPQPVVLGGEVLTSVPSGGVGTCQPSVVTVVVELGAELPGPCHHPPCAVQSHRPLTLVAPFRESWGLAPVGSDGELETPARPPTPASSWPTCAHRGFFPHSCLWSSTAWSPWALSVLKQRSYFSLHPRQ